MIEFKPGDKVDFKPGDIANGHFLGTENAWHPVAGVPPQGPTYWGRYRKRWAKTYLTFALVLPVGFLFTPTATSYGLNVFFGSLLLEATVFAACVASFVNFLVAIPGTTEYRQSWPGQRTDHRSYGKLLVVLGVAALVLGIGGTVISNNTPEKAYLSAMHRAAPAGASSTDAQYLTSGHAVCAVYAVKGQAGVETALADVYQTRGAEIHDVMTVVARAATTYLCPAQDASKP